MDGALPWAWAAVKPLYLEGIADQAVVRFREGMTLPTLGSLTGEEPTSVDDVLASYDHSNTINLFALGALVAWLRGKTAAAGSPERGPRLPPPDVTLPELASQDDVSPDVWALVQRLNGFGDKEQVILASMYRHLAHAPAFLHRVEAALAPVAQDGSLERAIATNRAEAAARARVIARAISAPAAPDPSKIEAAVSAFVDHAIGKMVTICRAIRVARTSNDQNR
jgi:hypothetical protein